MEERLESEAREAFVLAGGCCYFLLFLFFLLGYAATIVLCSPTAIDSLLSHTHRSARAKPVKFPIVYPTSDTPLKNCGCV